MAAPSKSLVASKLELSRLDQSAIQQEIMGKDLDLENLLIYFKSKIRFSAVDLVLDARVNRTIEGASTLTITLNDQERSVLRSGYLANKLDIQVDGLWFRLVKVQKTGDKITLTFEDREIAILRTYQDKKVRNKPTKIAKRALATRAEFVLNLIREVKEFKIPVVIPELHQVQPIESEADLPGEFDVVVNKTNGIAYDAARPDTTQHGVREGTTTRGEDPNRFVPGITDFPSAANRAAGARGALTVKGQRPSNDQINMANIILSVGGSMGVPRKVLVCAIMTAITESSLTNLAGGDADSVGLFQQRGNGAWGTLRDRRDPATSARMFYLSALKAHAEDPTRPYWDLCATVQIPREDLRDEYDKWRVEGDRFVTAYGVVGGDIESEAAAANNSFSPTADSGDYFYYRGDPQDGGKTWKPENSWTCIQRLANEVGWRAFFVSGRFYFITEDDLLKSKPLMTIQEFDEGVETIDGDYDNGKKAATVTLRVRVGRWTAPPGAVVVLRGMGPWNGRWLVSTFERSLFSSLADITLKKRSPKLPEPSKNAVEPSDSGGWGSPGDAQLQQQTVGLAGSPFPYAVTKDMVISTPAQHKTRALGNWQSDDAYDIKAEPGTPVTTVVAGTIVAINLSRQDLHEGNVFGAQVTIKGDDGVSYFYTHIEAVPISFSQGTKLFKGQQIGRVTLWTSSPDGTHLHIGSDSLLALEAIFFDGVRVS